LSTAGGSRAHKIAHLIKSQRNTLPTTLPDLTIENDAENEEIQSLTELTIGPFRGFTTEETFSFDKNFIFMYGPNGSGKSSFCEGLEYALHGTIQEAESKRINLDAYIKNVQSVHIGYPKVKGLSTSGKLIDINTNPTKYRFSFIEKNRIDNFARISATTASTQKNRIANLFGLEIFSSFVDGFTDNFNNEAYLSYTNKKFADSKSLTQSLTTKKLELEKQIKSIETIDQDSKALVASLLDPKIQSMDDMKSFLVGQTGTKGKLNELQEMKAEKIPANENVELFQLISTMNNTIAESIKNISTKLELFYKNSSEISFSDLYTAVQSINEVPSMDKDICPACKTPLTQAKVNPFEYAKSELSRLDELVKLQKEIPTLGRKLETDIRLLNGQVATHEKSAKAIGHQLLILPIITEYKHISIESLKDSLVHIAEDARSLENELSKIQHFPKLVESYNTSLIQKRQTQDKLDEEIAKFQEIKENYDLLIAKKKAALERKDKLEKEKIAFESTHERLQEEIIEEQKIVDSNTAFLKSYKKIIYNLKHYRNQLPSVLAAGLSENTKAFYNIINAHDPDFEQLEYLALPKTPDDIIQIRFCGSPSIYNPLKIFSEGHLKVLGLSILLSKIVQDDLKFIIFDDVVNAIDDDHRDGIAELLLKNTLFKSRQQIITCHGDLFISKLEHKLGQSEVSKHVKKYRFVPSDIIEERGIKISNGDPKHYVIRAKEAHARDERKVTAGLCRQAVEALTEALWIKLGKTMQISISVSMRTPKNKPDLYSVVNGLIKSIKKLPGLEELTGYLTHLKENYNWLLLNKGIHEQGDLPEFERTDLTNLLALIDEIEDSVSNLKLVIHTTK